MGVILIAICTAQKVSYIATWLASEVLYIAIAIPFGVVSFLLCSLPIMHKKLDKNFRES